MNQDEAVVVRTYASEVIASIAASSLGSAGIEAHIQKDDCGGAYPALQMSRGVRLLVKPEDVEEAEKILLDMEMQDTGEAEEPEEPEDREKTKSNPILLIGLFLLGLVAGYFLSSSIYDRSGYTGKVKKDFNPAGKPGVFGHFVEGKLARVEQDRNYDGTPDAWHKFGGGRIRTAKYDDNFDGKEDTWVTYKDRFNYFVKTDTDYDGKPDATVYFVNDLKQRTDWQPGDSVIIERRQYFDGGVLTEELVDTDRDGIFDLKITYDRYEKPISKSKCRIPSYSNRR